MYLVKNLKDFDSHVSRRDIYIQKFKDMVFSFHVLIKVQVSIIPDSVILLDKQLVPFRCVHCQQMLQRE